MSVSSQMLAQVVVDVAGHELGDRLFSYVVPSHLTPEVKVGTKVMVPFGHQEPLNARVVAVDNEDTLTSGTSRSLKEVLDVVDDRQLFDKQYIEFLRAVADYYLTPLSAVIAAALPDQLNARVKRVAQLCCAQVGSAAYNLEPEARAIFEVLSARVSFRASLRSLRKESGLKSTAFYRGIALLKSQGLVAISSELPPTPGPKLLKTVVWAGKQATTLRQESILELLKGSDGVEFSQLLKMTGATRNTIMRMAQAGIVNISELQVMRDPLKQYAEHDLGRNEQSVATDLPELTAEQARAYQTLVTDLRSIDSRLNAQVDPGIPETPAQLQPWLLYGVTGSGKTEIYLRLIAESLKLGKSALLMVPEISLTPQLALRLIERFGDLVSVWHSGLSPGERYDTWRRLKAGKIKVLLGARSAVFADLPNLGIIVLDEEHDASYKQSSPAPRYHARHVALEKARRCGAMIVLGSATPDMVSLYNARKHGRVLSLTCRVFEQPMPAISLVDMRLELQQGQTGIFSRHLRDSITACLERQEQSILLINRRGFAHHVFCKACGYVVKCKHCSVSLVLHQRKFPDQQFPRISVFPFDAGTRNARTADSNAQSSSFQTGATSKYLECHHCGFQLPFRQICPSCESPLLEAYGLGTQRIQQDLQRIFPQARILRLDSDVIAKKGAYQAIFRQFASGEGDILVGTQMVAKGLDIAKVSLVGVLAADAAFNLPDYRSTERGFQLLMQVAGRAGRRQSPGMAILQTYSTELPALKLAQQHDFDGFAESELKSRKQLDYPPFSQIIRLVVSGPELIEVQAFCEELAEDLCKFLEEEASPASIKILGPAPCLVERVRGSYRYHLLVKNLAGMPGQQLIASFLRKLRVKPGLVLAIDVDAVDLL